VKHFQSGNPFDADWDKLTNGVIVMPFLESASVQVSVEVFRLRCLIMDLLSTGKENIDGQRQNSEDVINDCLQISNDLLAYLDKVGYQVETEIGLGYEIFLEKTSISLTPFVNRFENLYAGVDVAFVIATPYDFDYCSIPFN